MPSRHHIRALAGNPDAADADAAADAADIAADIAIVAERMRQTLIEVLGPERGRDLYTLEWLQARVRWHLDPSQCVGQVFIAEPDADNSASADNSDNANANDGIIGHTIVRIDKDERGQDIGLFSTTYVIPAWRHRGVARSLLARGEAWMRTQRMTRAVTYTDKDNTRLQNLYLAHGYRMSAMPDDFVQLAKDLSSQPPET